MCGSGRYFLSLYYVIIGYKFAALNNIIRSAGHEIRLNAKLISPDLNRWLFTIPLLTHSVAKNQCAYFLSLFRCRDYRWCGYYCRSLFNRVLFTVSAAVWSRKVGQKMIINCHSSKNIIYCRNTISISIHYKIIQVFLR